MSLISISHLSFTHAGSSEPVFTDLNLQLDTDWKLGLIGRNGRGKNYTASSAAGKISLSRHHFRQCSV